MTPTLDVLEKEKKRVVWEEVDDVDQSRSCRIFRNVFLTQKAMWSHGMDWCDQMDIGYAWDLDESGLQQNH